RCLFKPVRPATRGCSFVRRRLGRRRRNHGLRFLALGRSALRGGLLGCSLPGALLGRRLLGNRFFRCALLGCGLLHCALARAFLGHGLARRLFRGGFLGWSLFRCRLLRWLLCCCFRHVSRPSQSPAFPRASTRFADTRMKVHSFWVFASHALMREACDSSSLSNYRARLAVSTTSRRGVRTSRASLRQCARSGAATARLA